MNELHLFAGAGGGILGGSLLGHSCVCAVEIDAHCRQSLLQRQRDGVIERFPIWDDITTFDGTPWRGRVDAVCGGFPCQDISVAGKGAGIGGARSGLWKHNLRVINEIRPRFVFSENSPAIRTRGLHTVLKDLAEVGYDARWCVLGAGDIGAKHLRKRFWLLAYPNMQSLEERGGTGGVDTAYRCRPDECQRGGADDKWQSIPAVSGVQVFSTSGFEGSLRPVSGRWWEDEPGVVRVAPRVASWMDRIRAVGNGQTPAVAAIAFRILSTGLI